MVSLAVTVWGRVSDPSVPSAARQGSTRDLSSCACGKKACRALLGLDGSLTRPYTGCASPYFTIGTLTCFFFAKALASS
jgi:hypothetical protein